MSRRRPRLVPVCPQCGSTHVRPGTLAIQGKVRTDGAPGPWETLTFFKGLRVLISLILVGWYLYFFIQMCLGALPRIFRRLDWEGILLLLAFFLGFLMMSPLVAILGRNLLFEVPNAPQLRQFRCDDCRFSWTMVRENSRADWVRLEPEPVNLKDGIE